MATKRRNLLLTSLGVAVSTGAGCVLVMDTDFSRYDSGEQGGEPDGGAGGTAGQPSDADAPEAGEAGGAGAGGAAGACSGSLVINEIQTKSVVNQDDEFVELFNASNCPVVMDGFELLYRSASGSTDLGPWTPAPNTVVEPFTHFLIGGEAFSGTADSSLPLGMRLSADGGGLALRGTDVIDRVGWGTAANAYVDGMPAPAPAAGESIARHPDGADTNNNMVDLVVGTPTPGAAN